METRESEKHLVKVSGDVYAEKCCQTSERPHRQRISKHQLDIIRTPERK